MFAAIISLLGFGNHAYYLLWIYLPRTAFSRSCREAFRDSAAFSSLLVRSPLQDYGGTSPGEYEQRWRVFICQGALARTKKRFDVLSILLYIYICHTFYLSTQQKFSILRPRQDFALFHFPYAYSRAAMFRFEFKTYITNSVAHYASVQKE